MTLTELLTAAQASIQQRAALARDITTATARIADLIEASSTLTTIRDTSKDELGADITSTTEELNFTLADVLTETQAAIAARARLITALATENDDWELTQAQYVQEQRSAIVKAKSAHY